jgi:hypothetical protein
MDRENKDRIEFHDDWPYAILYHSWDGLRIVRCKTKEYMDQVFDELSSCYKYIQKITTENIK